MNKKIYSLVLVVCCILSGCWSNNKREVTKNSVYKMTMFGGKDTKQLFTINLQGSNGQYGSFSLNQDGTVIMALDFTSVMSNNGRKIVFNAEPRESVLTDWQRKNMSEDVDYTVTVVMQKKSEEYHVKLTNVPPGYEDQFAYSEIHFGMFLEKDIINDYFDEVELQRLKKINGSGATLYYGAWSKIIPNILFLLYAIVFGIFVCLRDAVAVWRHIVLTAILLVTFIWDFAPGRAFIFTYYLCMPIMYIPFFKNKVIEWIAYMGVLVSMVIIGFNAWKYLGFFAWLFDMVCWGFVALYTTLYFMEDLTSRCSKCGRYALSWRGRTEKFDQAEEHFYSLKSDGSDIDYTPKESSSYDDSRTRCAHCFTAFNGQKEV